MQVISIHEITTISINLDMNEAGAFRYLLENRLALGTDRHVDTEQFSIGESIAKQVISDIARAQAHNDEVNNR